MDVAPERPAQLPGRGESRGLTGSVTTTPPCALMRGMSQEPDTPRRLEWPELRDPDDEADVIDPAGNWLPEGDSPGGQSPLFDSLLFREQRWAPQHGARGRSESALPGAFLFPEPEAAPEFEPAPAEGQSVATEEERHHRAGSLLREVVETLLLAILVFLAVRASVQHYRVEGHSMDPTLEDGEFLLVNSLVYSEVNLDKLADWVPFWDPGGPDNRHVFHPPERGDIVILHPRQHSERDLVKRVVGLPGDNFEIRSGVVYINGRQLIEPYIAQPWAGDYPLITIPANHYFVMGDNRGASADSRSFGPVNEDDIVGKAMASWWPRDKWGLAPNEEPSLGPER